MSFDKDEERGMDRKNMGLRSVEAYIADENSAEDDDGFDENEQEEHGEDEGDKDEGDDEECDEKTGEKEGGGQRTNIRTRQQTSIPPMKKVWTKEVTNSASRMRKTISPMLQSMRGTGTLLKKSTRANSKNKITTKR